MKPTGNMGPFGLASLKGNARINAVPSFRNQLPLTRGGIAARNLPFGVMVSCDPANPTHFYPGLPDEKYIVAGISMLDPTIMTNDPGMNNMYFAGRPATIVMMGILQFSIYDTTQSAPSINGTVWGKKDTGEIAFNDGTDISGSGYVKLNAFVTDIQGPNGADVFFQIPIVAGSKTATPVTKAATPKATPAAGAVAANTVVKLSTTSAGATIYYTIDGTAPTTASTVYNDANGITVTAAVTIKALASGGGFASSDVLSAAYTIKQ